MEESAFFLDIVTTLYEEHPHALEPLYRNSAEEGKYLYKVSFTDGAAWVLRAFKQHYDQTKPFQLLSHSLELGEWIEGQAHLLAYLASQSYQAPRPVATRTGELVARYEDWYIFTTTFIDGDPKDAGVAKIGALGTALGQLHTLPSAYTAADSWWAQACFANGFTRLTSSAHAVYDEMQELYRTSLATFQYFLQHPPLPQTLVHADCWAENGILTPEGQAVLIDWECAGRGIAVIDFGALLLHSHFDQMDQQEDEDFPHYHADAERITAVVDGYTRWRRLSPTEEEALLEAIRFSVAWRAAMFFFLIALRGTADERMKRRLRRWQQLYAISEEICRLAQEALLTR